MKTKKMIGILALMVSLLFLGCPPETEGTDVESLTLTSPQEYLAPGQTLTLSAAVVPETAAVTFESDNLGVATVDEKGVVKGVSEGTAIITASAGTKTDDVAVTVIPYTSISIKELESYTIALGTTLQLELEWEPASVTAPKNVKWVSSNPETFSVDEATGLVTSNSSTESAEIYAEIYSGALKTAAVTVRGEKAPAPRVENLRAFTGDSRYTIYWDAVEGAEGYNLYYTAEETKPANATRELGSETTFFLVSPANNGDIINIWVEAIVADTIPLENPASTTVTVGYTGNANQTVTIEGEDTTYILDREVNFLEGTLAPSEYMGDREVEFSVDPESGVLTTKGGTGTTGDDYNSETNGAGANSWLIWTPPADVLSIENYDYIEVELKTSGRGSNNGFWTVLNHANNNISYELVHYNGKSPNGWFISYGGVWRNNGKSQKFHAGTAVSLPEEGSTDYHQFGILFPDKTPSKIRLYSNRTNQYHTNDNYNGGNANAGPDAWTTGATTTFEFIFGANDCPNYQAEISKIRYYKASESATPSP